MAPAPARSRHPIWLALLATLLPGGALVVLALVLLEVRQRAAHREVAAEVRTAAESAPERIGRELTRRRAALQRRLAEQAPARREEDGALWFDLERRGEGSPWAMQDGPPVTVPLVEQGRYSALLRGVERSNVSEEEKIDRAQALLEDAQSQRVSGQPVAAADFVRVRLGLARALRRIGRRQEALAELEDLLADPALAVDAALERIPVVFAARLELVTLRFEELDDPGAAPAVAPEERARTAARELLDDLAQDRVALPAGEVVAHVRDALTRLAPLLEGELPGDALAPLEVGKLRPVVLDEREEVERLAGLLGNLGSGAGLTRLVEKDGRPAVLVAVRDETARRAAGCRVEGSVLAARLEAGPGIAAELSVAPATGPEEFVESVALEEPPGLVCIARAAPELVEERVRPWRLAVFTGVGMVAVMSLLSAALAMRAVRRQLRLARLRSELVASISHELRTPLTGMLLHLELLDDPRADAAARRESVVRLRDSAERLQKLVERVLDFARSERGAATSERSEEQPGRLLEAAREEMHELLEGRAVDLDVASALPRVTVDRHAIVQVLVGLLDNALKYAGDEVPIVLRARRGERGRVRLEVEDRGPGVPDAERELLLEPFYRAPSRRGGAGGLGLGLAIARRIVEDQGGRLTVEPTAAGAGAEGLRCVIELAGAGGLPAAKAPGQAGRRDDDEAGEA